MPSNYKKIYAMKKDREQKIQTIRPDITNESGIYAFCREDENGFKFAYIGQAKHLLERTASHLAEYDRIGLSLKKRGFFNAENNTGGWRLSFKTCPTQNLDEFEMLTIKSFADKGYQLYNSTGGSQGKGKFGLGDGKTPKTYWDGVKQGELKARKTVADLFAKHLDYAPKKTPPTKLQEKAIEKFKAFIDIQE